MDTIGNAVLLCVFVVIVFIFKGEPDLFDKWQDVAHARADVAMGCTNEQPLEP